MTVLTSSTPRKPLRLRWLATGVVLALIAGPAPAKAVAVTTLAQAGKGAPVIAFAETARGELESLKDGESKEVDVFALWVEYKVTEVLRDRKTSGLKAGRVLRLTSRSNSCIRYKTVASRSGDTITLKHGPEGNTRTETRSLKAMKARRGKRVALFLTVGGEADKPAFGHFGWFISGRALEKGFEAKLKAELAKSAVEKP